MSCNIKPMAWFMFAQDDQRSDRCEMVKRAQRCAALLQPNYDVIFYPEGYPELENIWRYTQETFGFAAWQVHFFRHKEEDGSDRPRMDIYNEVFERLGQLGLSEVTIMPMYPSLQLKNMCTVKGHAMYGDCQEDIVNKDWLHPRPSENTTIHRLKTCKTGVLNVPLGFSCFTPDEMLQAYDILTNEYQVEKFCLKPAGTSGGKGIILDPTKEQIEEFCASSPYWECAPILIEELLDIDRKPDGGIISVSAHFTSGRVNDRLTEQYVKDEITFCGAKTAPLDVEESIIETCHQHAEILNKEMQWLGLWGIDFLIVKGEPYLVDINAGRPNMCHFPYFFTRRYAPGKHWWYVKEFLTNANITAQDVQRHLECEGLLFKPGMQSGIALLSHSMYETLVVFVADTHEEINALYNTWQSIVRQLRIPIEDTMQQIPIEATIQQNDAINAQINDFLFPIEDTLQQIPIEATIQQIAIEATMQQNDAINAQLNNFLQEDTLIEVLA